MVDRIGKSEISVDKKLASLQSTLIPNHIAEISLDLMVGNASCMIKHGHRVPFQVKGLVLELLEGCELSDPGQHYPVSQWQQIGARAVVTVKLMDDYNIYNFEARAGNPVGDAESDEPRVVMFDFGFCRFRRFNETDFFNAVAARAPEMNPKEEK